MLRLQRSIGNRAVCERIGSDGGAGSLTLARTPADDVRAAEAELAEIKDVAEDFLEELGLGEQGG